MQSDSKKEKVLFKHPHSGEIAEVVAEAEFMVPYMVRGFEQVRTVGAAPEARPTDHEGDK